MTRTNNLAAALFFALAFTAGSVKATDAETVKQKVIDQYASQYNMSRSDLKAEQLTVVPISKGPGSSWDFHVTGSFVLAWANPRNPGEAAIVMAHRRVCALVGKHCQEGIAHTIYVDATASNADAGRGLDIKGRASLDQSLDQVDQAKHQEHLEERAERQREEASAKARKLREQQVARERAIANAREQLRSRQQQERDTLRDRQIEELRRERDELDQQLSSISGPKYPRAAKIYRQLQHLQGEGQAVIQASEGDLGTLQMYDPERAAEWQSLLARQRAETGVDEKDGG